MNVKDEIKWEDWMLIRDGVGSGLRRCSPCNERDCCRYYKVFPPKGLTF